MDRNSQAKWSRRQWIQTLLMTQGVSTAWAANSAGAAPADRLLTSDVLYGGCRYQASADAPFQYALARVLPDIPAVDLAPCDFFPHGWAIDPHDPRRVVFFQKEGLGAAIFDLARLQVVMPIPPLGERQFYGHGAFANGGKWLLSTESEPNGQGVIGIRDAKSLAHIGDFPSYGHRPHDCHLVDGGRVLVVANGGGSQGSTGPDAQRPCISYIDVSTRALLRRHVMPDPAYNTGHLAPMGRDRAVVVSAPRLGLGPAHPGAVSRCDRRQKELQVMRPPEGVPALLGEALSVAVLTERGMAAVTHPTAGWLSFWDLTRGRYHSGLAVDRVRGVVPSGDGRSLWLSHGGGASLSRLVLGGASPALEPVMAQSLLAGSHLLNWPLTGAGT